MIDPLTSTSQSEAAAKLAFEKRRLKKACDQFGALLTDELLHAMRAGTLRGEAEGESQQIYESMFDHAVALRVSEHQHGGLSSLLYRQLLPLLTEKAKPASPRE